MAAPLTEADIRPAALFDAYLALVASDVETYFSAPERHEMECPACSHPGEPAFEKLGFAYRECPDCRSLWVSPRPSFSAFSAFYAESPSAEYWADVFTPAVAEVRRVKLWGPKARQIQQLAERYGNAEAPFRAVIDIGGGNGVFAREFSAISSHEVVVIEPSPAAARACRESQVPVIEAFLEDVSTDQLPEGPRVFTSFELFEHVHDPRTWMESIGDLMNPGDLLVMTTLSGTGLDIRLLWEESASVNPPHHINFLNPASIRILAENCGFRTLEVFTPGQLDIDILRANQEKLQDHFWPLILNASVDVRASWQSFVASSGCSSHMWAVLKR
jgi:hypothetical protein